MVREAFGDEMTIYADSNSSYDVPNAIRIGRTMEEHNYAWHGTWHRVRRKVLL